MGKKGLFERIKRSDDQRAAADRQDRDRESGRTGTGLFQRVEQARKESGTPMYRRDTQNLRTSDVRRGVTSD